MSNVTHHLPPARPLTRPHHQKFQPGTISLLCSALLFSRLYRSTCCPRAYHFIYYVSSCTCKWPLLPLIAAVRIDVGTHSLFPQSYLMLSILSISVCYHLEINMEMIFPSFLTPPRRITNRRCLIINCIARNAMAM